ncbi:helix-turn-helix transcriptional regulator [Paenibacillus sp. FSL R5-0527]|uniref:helix-turn-helix domain-containing protein n=1 Tax=Paenibacillus sp. FSL R5-0527 TaxID=2975321 RepID=UPI00097AE071|nr:hypothetical protein BK140_32605 [Paenibacillus macerans]
MLDKKTLGKILKTERERRNMTQEELAEKSGLSRSYVCDLESGRYFPGVKTLMKISNGLGGDCNLIDIALKGEEIHA